MTNQRAVQGCLHLHCRRQHQHHLLLLYYSTEEITSPLCISLCLGRRIRKKNNYERKNIRSQKKTCDTKKGIKKKDLQVDDQYPFRCRTWWISGHFNVSHWRRPCLESDWPEHCKYRFLERRFLFSFFFGVVSLSRNNTLEGSAQRGSLICTTTV